MDVFREQHQHQNHQKAPHLMLNSDFFGANKVQI